MDCGHRRMLDLMCYIAHQWHMFLYQLAQACLRNVLHVIKLIVLKVMVYIKNHAWGKAKLMALILKP